MQLEPDESKRLASAVEKVLRLHGLNRAMSPAAAAYWQLGAAVANIYGRRIAYASTLRKEAAEQQQRPPEPHEGVAIPADPFAAVPQANVAAEKQNGSAEKAPPHVVVPQEVADGLM